MTFWRDPHSRVNWLLLFEAKVKNFKLFDIEDRAYVRRIICLNFIKSSIVEIFIGKIEVCGLNHDYRKLIV